MVGEKIFDVPNYIGLFAQNTLLQNHALHYADKGNYLAFRTDGGYELVKIEEMAIEWGGHVKELTLSKRNFLGRRIRLTETLNGAIYIPSPENLKFIIETEKSNRTWEKVKMGEELSVGIEDLMGKYISSLT